MLVRTPKDIGALIRDVRRRRNLDQASLARTVGVTRQWIIEVEKGAAGASIGVVLRILGALGVRLSIEDVPQAGSRPTVDIDEIVSTARRRRP